MRDRLRGGGVGKRARGASAALAIAGAIVGGCWGTAGGPGAGPATVDVVLASASRRLPSGEGSQHPWVAPEPTTWPLPYASYYANMPPAGSNGGPTKPCPPHVDWGPSKPLPAGSGRQAGLACADFQPVRYPVCTEEQVAHAWRIDAAMAPPIGPPDVFGPAGLRPFALRGYLRRDSTDIDADYWQLSIEAAGTDGACNEMAITGRPDGVRGPAPPRHEDGRQIRALCRGDASMACCTSPLVGAQDEIIYETGMSDGQLCVVSAAADQSRVRAFRRDEERAFDRKSKVGMCLPLRATPTTVLSQRAK